MMIFFLKIYIVFIFKIIFFTMIQFSIVWCISILIVIKILIILINKDVYKIVWLANSISACIYQFFFNKYSFHFQRKNTKSVELQTNVILLLQARNSISLHSKCYFNNYSLRSFNIVNSVRNKYDLQANLKH